MKTRRLSNKFMYNMKRLPKQLLISIQKIATSVTKLPRRSMTAKRDLKMNRPLSRQRKKSLFANSANLRRFLFRGIKDLTLLKQAIMA